MKSQNNNDDTLDIHKLMHYKKLYLSAANNNWKNILEIPTRMYHNTSTEHKNFNPKLKKSSQTKEKNSLKRSDWITAGIIN